MTEQKGSFWSTLPGIITAIGGLIAAVAGLVTALYTAGIIGRPAEKNVTSNSLTTQVQASPNARKADVILSQIDRTDAKSTAQAVLDALRARDVISLAGLVNKTNRKIFVELAEQGEKHPRYDSIFGENGLQSGVVRYWNGQLGEARYRHFAGTARNSYEAQVKFSEIDQGRVLVVTLTWEEGKWNFEDIHRPTSEDFMKGSSTFRLGSAPY